MSEKINFAWPVTAENAVVLQCFQQRIALIKESLFDKRIVIFGAGIRGCGLCKMLENNGLVNIVFCDNNTEKQGNLINQYDIISFIEALKYGGKQVFLVSPENSDGLLVQLKTAGLIENEDWYSFSVDVYDDYVEEYLRTISNHILFLGDCAFNHISAQDTNLDSLGDMLKKEIGSEYCKVLAMHGIGQRAHYNIVNSLLAQSDKPKIIVLLLVMECLTSKAHIMPRSQHPVLLKKLLNVQKNLSEEFREYARLTEDRFNRFQVESFASSKSIGDEASEKLFMQMNYLFKIKEETEGVVYLKKTVKLMNDEGIPIVLYVPPVNYEQGEKFFGADFRIRYEDNFKKVYAFLDNEGLNYSVADASYLLSSCYFAATNTIDETTNSDGRLKLVKFFSNNEYMKGFFSK